MLWGVDYYPEHWDEDRWAGDADKMRDFGFTAVRMMEFAWSVVEPERGRYDFSLFKRAMDVLWKRGIQTVVGTPTAAVPVWLAEADIFQTRLEGNAAPGSVPWGGRREACFNAPAYRDAALSLAREIGKAFGTDERVIGFQIDNEPGHEGSDRCVCPRCAAAWRAWLEKRYGTPDALNRAWGNVFWGRTLAAFGQAPLPSAASSVNPSLVLDYDRFSSEAAADFIRAQTVTIKSMAPGKWITTNLYPPPLSNAIDQEELCAGMDFPSFDNYPVWGDQAEPLPYVFTSAQLAWTRGLDIGKAGADSARAMPCIMEQFAGQQGHTCMGYLPPPAQVALWTNQAVSRGADKVFYFRWRTAPFGREQLCRGIFDNDDAETDRSRAIKENLARLGGVFSRFASVRPECPVALIHDKDSTRLLRHQYLSKGMYLPMGGFAQAGPDAEYARQAAPYVVFNVPFDFVSSAFILRNPGELSRYRLIALPLYEMADPAMAAALETWVADGGILVLSWRTGARNLENKAPRESAPGPFRKLAGLKVAEFESLNEGRVALRARGTPAFLPLRGEVFAELLELEDARAEAWYSDGRKFYSGIPAVARHPFGKGETWYFGTSPDTLSMFFLYKRILKRAGLRPRFMGEGVEAVERATEDGSEVTVLLNHNARPRRALGVRLGPWETAVIEKGKRIG
jgi:beta-galactosidase